MNIVPFLPHHVLGLDVHNGQKIGLPTLDLDYGIYLYQSGPSFSCEVEGAIIACGGNIRIWPGRASAWALLSPTSGKHMARITRAVIRFFEVSEDFRIETTVDDGFEAGHRWAKLLGFEREGYMKKYRPNGQDAWLYARVR